VCEQKPLATIFGVNVTQQVEGEEQSEIDLNHMTAFLIFRMDEHLGSLNFFLE